MIQVNCQYMALLLMNCCVIVHHENIGWIECQCLWWAKASKTFVVSSVFTFLHLSLNSSVNQYVQPVQTLFGKFLSWGYQINAEKAHTYSQTGPFPGQKYAHYVTQVNCLLTVTLHIVDVRLTCLINITYLLTYLPFSRLAAANSAQTDVYNRRVTAGNDGRFVPKTKRRNKFAQA